MKRIPLLLAALAPLAAFAADNPDQSFFDHAAEGGLAEVSLGKLAQEKASDPKVKEFGAMMVTDHSAANEKLKALAAKEGVKLPTSPGVGQMATKAKLEVLTGDTFDKSYVKGMVKDHEEDVALFRTEATSGKDAGAKAFAAATLPTLEEHLKKIRSIAAARGIKVD